MAVWDALTPAIEGARERIGQALQGLSPMLEAFKGLWESLSGDMERFTAGVEQMSTGSITVFEGFKTTVGGIFTSMFETPLAAVQGFVDTVIGLFDSIGGRAGEALDGLRSGLSGVSDVLGNVRGALPDWLVPGSPTPFELGLRGIADAVAPLSNMFQSLAGPLGAAGDAGESGFSALLEAIANVLTESQAQIAAFAAQVTGELIPAFVEMVLTQIQEAAAQLAVYWQAAWETLTRVTENGVANIERAIEGLADAFAGVVSQWISDINTLNLHFDDLLTHIQQVAEAIANLPPIPTVPGAPYPGGAGTTVPAGTGPAGGGYVGHMFTEVGERGTEFVLSHRSTRRAEQLVGGMLSQERLLAALSPRAVAVATPVAAPVARSGGGTVSVTVNVENMTGTERQAQDLAQFVATEVDHVLSRRLPRALSAVGMLG